MFLGEYTSSITAGKRIAIPKLFRERAGEEDFVITKGYEQCLVIVGKSSFEKLLTGVSDVPFIATVKRDTSRFLMSSAHEVVPDDQGRFVMPEGLIQFANLVGKEVVFIGVGTWVEVWDPALWDRYKKKLEKESANIADKLVSLSTQA